MSAERSTPRSRRDQHFESFGVWMFSIGFLGGFFIGAVFGSFFW